MSDVPALWPLVQRLNSYNLPADRRVLTQIVSASVRSFRGQLPKSRARYLFVLETWPSRRLVGCSLIIAKHGTPALPHLWLDVRSVRMTSHTLRRTISHQVLQLGATTDGPSEVGGLIVHPRSRGHPLRLGRQLSYVRFAYMAMHPDRFESRVLVEYLPPLTPAGDSLLWRTFGRQLTGLSYRAADRLSVANKEFILSLFPKTPVYTTWFPARVRAQLGVVHPAARGACGMLKAIGFRDLRQIEPFDGGPYYGASRDRVTLIRRTHRGRLVPAAGVPLRHEGFVCAEPRRGEFRAVSTRVRVVGSRIWIPDEVLACLEVSRGARGYVTLAG